MTTTEICNLTGLSMDRVQQFAKSEKIKKTGRDYHFTQEQYELFKSRIGRRGRPAKEEICHSDIDPISLLVLKNLEKR